MIALRPDRPVVHAVLACETLAPALVAREASPADMGAVEVTRFLTALAVQGNVTASTQNQALCALLFLYREVLGGALLLYGAGLRLLERCRLRVKDVNFATNQIVVRNGKGYKDRVTMLPAAVKVALAAHFERVHEAPAKNRLAQPARSLSGSAPRDITAAAARLVPQPSGNSPVVRPHHGTATVLHRPAPPRHTVPYNSRSPAELKLAEPQRRAYTVGT